MTPKYRALCDRYGMAPFIITNSIFCAGMYIGSTSGKLSISVASVCGALGTNLLGTFIAHNILATEMAKHKIKPKRGSSILQAFQAGSVVVCTAAGAYWGYYLEKYLAPAKAPASQIRTYPLPIPPAPYRVANLAL